MYRIHTQSHKVSSFHSTHLYPIVGQNVLHFIYLLTYLLRPLNPPGAPTTFLQRLLSWAILSSCCQPFPVCLMSDSRSRRQVFFGLPLFLLPWGFHVRTCLVMSVLGFLKVWPSHPPLLLRISVSIWAWCVLSQRSLYTHSLYILSLILPTVSL